MATIPSDWLKARGTGQFLKNGTAVRGLDLRRADLGDIRLDRLDASGADFREADLLDFRAVDCNFEGANFVGAGMSGAMFHDCVLSGANLNACLLKETMLADCMFMDANLEDASLERADVSGSFFTRARLRNAELRQAQAKQAIFKEADLSEADLTETNFEGADFRGARLAGARWDAANLAGARFDPGTGKRMLDDALRMAPEHDPSSYAVYECREGDKLWHSIEHRGSSAAKLRVNQLALAGEYLEIDFERVDASFPQFVSYALIERVLLRDFLLDEWRAHAQRLRFRERNLKNTFDLPQ